MSDELSTEQLAAEVDEIRQHLDGLRRQASFRDDVAEWQLRSQPEAV
jgi:hypothetical protein